MYFSVELFSYVLFTSDGTFLFAELKCTFVDENILVDGKVVQLFLFSSTAFMKYI